MKSKKNTEGPESSTIELELRRAHWLVFLLPAVMAALLFWGGFAASSEKMLTLFLPIIWGVLISLGGGLVFLKHFNPSGLDLMERKVSAHIMGFSLLLILQTAVFLLLSALYPAKGFMLHLSGSAGWITRNSGELCRAYECLLFCFIVVPSFASVLVGLWTLYLLLNREPAENA